MTIKPSTKPLDPGYGHLDKGGANAAVSQIVQRFPPSAPINRAAPRAPVPPHAAAESKSA